MHTQNNFRRKENERGFTLLMAALISSVVFALGASIFALAQKELTLSSIGRDSQFAFYAADTAAECALYWDFRFSYFATTTPEGVTPTCDTQEMGPFTVVPSQNPPYSSPYTMTSARMDFFKNVTPIGDFCAQVWVEKTINSSSGDVRTTIHADGYNVHCDQVDTSPRTLQRSVELHY